MDGGIEAVMVVVWRRRENGRLGGFGLLTGFDQVGGLGRKFGPGGSHGLERFVGFCLFGL